MNTLNLGMSRRGFMLSAAVTALLPGTAAADGVATGFRFSFTYKGHPFGAVITPLGKNLLLTLKSLKDKSFKTASVFQPRAESDITKAEARIDGKTVATVSFDEKTGLKLAGDGLLLNDYGGHPAGASPPPQSQGFFGWLGSIARGIGNAVTSLIGLAGAAIAWMLGKSIQWRNGWGEIQVFRDGTVWITVWGGSNGNGFMPPPDGTDEKPGIWY